MLSFMVVSAVGFSVYMRQSRLPSSYLRRNVSSRYLVKAALANAIEELDCGFMSNYEIGIDERANNPNSGRFYGIYDDPYPGCGSDSGRSNMQGGSRKVNGRSLSYCENGDLWVKRVFCPFGLLPFPSDETRAISEPPMTVPTLTLEALAYLPPAIIDDVRKVSRMTRTAMWRTLPYEAGRYAYTAVNVSDLFDINRLRAGEPRDSGLNRITLSTLTSTDPQDPSRVDQGRADTLDDLIDPEVNAKLKLGGGVVPFLSLADFELGAVGSLYAPLLSYVGGGASAILPDGQQEAANSMFITDTWFPALNTNTATKVYSLADGSGQPFQNFTANSVLTVLGSANADQTVSQLYQKNLGIGFACLYDYLDGDSVPISLAIPTTEAVPMVVGVSAPLGLQPMVGNIDQPLTSAEYPRPGTDRDGNQVNVMMVRTAQKVGVTGLGNRINLNVLLTYPFKRMKTSKRVMPGDFKLRGVLKVYLAPDGMGCRPNGRVGGVSPLYPLKADVLGAAGQGWYVGNGVATLLSDNFVAGQDITEFLNDDVKKTDEAVKPVLLQFSQLGVQMPMFWQVSENPSPNNPAGYTPNEIKQPYVSLDGMRVESAALRPLTAEGAFDAAWEQAEANNRIDDGLSTPQGPLAFTGLNASYRLYAAVWVQVVDRNGNVVDMAPATVQDDEWNNRASAGGAIMGRLDGSDAGTPLLNFKTGTDIPFDTALVTSLLTPPVFDGWKTLYAVDPRFNFAPEDWFSQSADVVDANSWITAIQPLLGVDGRDRDIFMFVSNQEYLQSIGELQFLPVLQDMNNAGSYMDGDYSTVYNRNPFSDRPNANAVANFAHGEFIWRTYSAYRLNDTVSDIDYQYTNPYTLPILCDAGGFKLNPFSEDNRVISAATILTPYDYYVAATNDNHQNADAKNKKAQLTAVANTIDQMRTTFSFGESPVAQLQHDDLLDINDTIRDAFIQAAERGNADWLQVWNDRNLMRWQLNDQNMVHDNNTDFLGLTPQTGSSPLHGVDRKYLYSFWRECFDNRQQLFLIFVNAEPASVGGGAAGTVSSSQQGGRAVALVWRDPAKPMSGTARQARPGGSIDRDQFRQDYKRDCPPHRTRVLFYHQFD